MKKIKVLLFVMALIAMSTITGCEDLTICKSNELKGTNGTCMYCTNATPSYTYHPGCSNVNNGVYCCP